MADCQQQQDDVNRLRQEVADQRAECEGITDPFVKKECLEAVGRLRDRLSRAEQALRNCLAGLPNPGIQEAQGRLTFLRAHEGGFGSPNDFLDGEVVFALDTQPGRAFGFQLRNDNARPVREGMLALLRDAFVNDFNVVVDYIQELNRANSVAFRIVITR